MKKTYIVAGVALSAVALSGCAGMDAGMQIVREEMSDPAKQELLAQAGKVALTAATSAVGMPWLSPVLVGAGTLLATAFGVHRKLGDAIKAVRPMESSS